MKHLLPGGFIALIALILIGIFGFTPEEQAGKGKGKGELTILPDNDSYVVDNEIGANFPYLTGVEPWDLKGKTVVKTEYYLNCVKLTFDDGYTLEVKTKRENLGIWVKDKAQRIESKNINKN